MRYIIVGATAAMALLGAALLATAHAQDDKAKRAAPEGKSPAERGNKGAERGPTSGESERAKQPAPGRKAEQRQDRPGKATQGTEPDRPRATQQQQPDRGPPKTTGPQQQDRDRPKATQQQQQDRDRPKAAQQQQRDRDRPQATEPQRKDDRPKTTEGGPRKDRADAKGDRSRVQVAEQNRRSAGDRVRQTRVERVQRSRINVSVSIGATIPRSVRLHTLPVVVFDVAPAYRGYSYVLLDDDTILIVDAHTHVIVDVIPAGSLRADRPGYLALSDEQMRFVFSRVTRDRTADVRVRLALGAEVPRSVELLAFPDEVTGRIGELGHYRYIVADGAVAVIDPDDRAVVLVIGN